MNVKWRNLSLLAMALWFSATAVVPSLYSWPLTINVPASRRFLIWFDTDRMEYGNRNWRWWGMEAVDGKVTVPKKTNDRQLRPDRNIPTPEDHPLSTRDAAAHGAYPYRLLQLRVPFDTHNSYN